MFVSSKPLVGLPACRREFDELPFHTIGDKYVRAVALASKAMPVMIPALEELTETEALLSRLDGLVMTGSPSNVHPERYGDEESEEAAPFDLGRDATTFPLIETAIAMGVPLFCICRGHQELNVALGGSLFPRVHELPGRMDHRSPKDPDMDVNYAPRHAVTLKHGGLLHRLWGHTEAEVNSLHWQAVRGLGRGLEVEATAPDGTIEALSMPGARGFVLSVQWHPEYKVRDCALSMTLFEAFGQAVHRRAEERYTSPVALVS